MEIRITIALLAYIFSSLGFLFMFQMILDALHSSTPEFLPLIWLSAWAIHLTMTIAWVNNRKLHTIFPVTGTILALVSLIWPVFSHVIDVGPILGYGSVMKTGLKSMLFASMLVLPCIILAVWLVKFHISKNNNAQS